MADYGVHDPPARSGTGKVLKVGTPHVTGKQDTVSEPTDAVRKNAMQGIASASEMILIYRGKCGDPKYSYPTIGVEMATCADGHKAMQLAGGTKLNSEDDFKKVLMCAA